MADPAKLTDWQHAATDRGAQAEIDQYLDSLEQPESQHENDSPPKQDPVAGKAILGNYAAFAEILRKRGPAQGKGKAGP